MPTVCPSMTLTVYRCSNIIIGRVLIVVGVAQQQSEGG